MEQPRTSGRAAAVSITVGTNARLYLEREVIVDPENGVVHLSDPGGVRHEITAPLAATVIQWIPEVVAERAAGLDDLNPMGL